MTTARLLADIIQLDGDIKTEAIAAETRVTSTYATINDLPISGLTAGDQAFVTSNNRLYISNGSGWYNVALINATPNLTISPSGAVTLATDGTTPTVITLTGTDSDNADASLTYSVESDGSFADIATLSQDSSVFTITPLAEGSATPGSSTLTFKVSDGISFGSGTTTFSLTFGPNWSATPTESKRIASDAVGGEFFGSAVELSGDGNYAIVGAQYGDVGATLDAGAAYIYLRTESGWIQQAKITASNAGGFDQFGKNGVSLNSDATYAMVGAPTEDTGVANAGMVYVFTRSGTNWSQQTTLQASDRAGAANFGDYVSLNSDATYAAIGAPGDPGSSSSEGAVYIFTRSGSTWTQQAKLVASDRAQSHYFGQPVSINDDGSYVITGAYGDSTSGTSNGAAYIFSRSGSTWTQQQKIKADVPASYEYFGWTLSINGDGSYAVISKYGDNSNTGAAYVYTRSGSTWTQQATLTASDGASGDRFAIGVSISRNGSFVIAGASGENDNGTNAGAAYVFKRSGSTWTQQRKIIASDIQASDYFGAKVSASNDGEYIIIGASREDGGSGDPKVDTGAAYIYEAG